MVPLNLLSKLAPRANLATLSLSRPITSSPGLLKQSGGKSKDRGDVCKQQCSASKKRKASKQCDSSVESFHKKGEDKEELPDYCSKQVAMECARKIQELQKQWEVIAAQAPDKGHDNRGPGRKSSCPVTPPKKEEEGSGNLLLILGGLALLAAVAWFIYTQSQEEKDKEKKENEEGKEE